MTSTTSFSVFPSTWTAITYTLYENISYTTVSMPSTIPTTLMNQSDVWYQQSWIGAETAMTFTDQDLTM